MVVLQAVLPFIGILVGLVVLHELGHYVVAKLSGVRVEEFGVGFPPRIWGKRFGETLYSINWLPLGGFVRLTGEESARVYVGQVNAQGAAGRAGIATGDVITKVNDKAVHSQEKLAAELRRAASAGTIALTLERPEDAPSGSQLVEQDVLLAVGEPNADAPPSPPAPAERDESAAATVGRIAGLQVTPDPRSLAAKPRRIRILVLAAGAGVNAILPIILFAIAALIPQTISAGPAVITSVIQGGPASQSGLQPGDRFVSINGKEIRNGPDVVLQINLNLGEDLDVVVERDVAQEGASQRRTTVTETFVTTVRARLAPERLEHVVQPGETVHDVADALGLTASQVLSAVGLGRGVALPAGVTLALPGGESYLIQPGDTAVSVGRDLGFPTQTVLQAAGIDLVNLPPGTEISIRQGPTGISIANRSGATTKHGEGFFAAVETGWNRTVNTLTVVRNRIRSWIAGGEGLRVQGPIGLAQATGEVVEQAGWLRLIELAAWLSLSLAILNILPLPMLDGGRIVFVLIEIARRGKRISPEREGLVHLTGFALLLIVGVVVAYFDIVRAISGESALR